MARLFDGLPKNILFGILDLLDVHSLANLCDAVGHNAQLELYFEAKLQNITLRKRVWNKNITPNYPGLFFALNTCQLCGRLDDSVFNDPSHKYRACDWCAADSLMCCVCGYRSLFRDEFVIERNCEDECRDPECSTYYTFCIYEDECKRRDIS